MPVRLIAHAYHERFGVAVHRQVPTRVASDVEQSLVVVCRRGNLGDKNEIKPSDGRQHRVEPHARY